MSSMSEPFAYNDMLPMLKALAEHVLDLQDDVDELMESGGVGGGATAGNQPVNLQPGFVPINESMLSQVLVVIQTIGFDGATPARKIPPDVERQLCRHVFCQISAGLTGQTPDQIAQQMRARYPNLDMQMPDLSKYL